MLEGKREILMDSFVGLLLGSRAQFAMRGPGGRLYSLSLGDEFPRSTMVGMVGAGGIGFELLATLRLMQYQQVAAILLAIFVVVQVVDSFGNLVRTRLVSQITT